MKRIAKYFMILLASLLFLTLLAYSAFRATQHFKGGQYISYLEENMSSMPLGTVYDFEIMEEDIDQHQLILVGEVHGFQAPTEWDPQFFSFLKKRYDVNYYLVEMDLVQAHYLNQYNRTGDENLLLDILDDWVVGIGRTNRDYQKKWQALRKVYLENRSFSYLGNNGISDLGLLQKYLVEEMDLELELPEASDSIKLSLIKEKLTEIPEESSTWEHKELLRNITYALNDKYREEVLTENLISLYDHYGLYDQKVYGFYGLGHTFLAPFDDGYESMASRFISAKPAMKDQVFSANFVFLDSEMTVRSASQPSFLRDEGEWTALGVSYDNLLVSYLYGIDDLRRVTEPNTLNMVRLNGKGSPYVDSQRLASMTKLLPFGMTLNADEGRVTTDYYDYLIFVRNSAWAEPFAYKQ